jgi:hypothetical protein
MKEIGDFEFIHLPTFPYFFNLRYISFLLEMNGSFDDYEPWFGHEERDEMEPMYIFIGSILSLAGITIAITGILYRCKQMKEKKEREKMKERHKKYIVDGAV